KVPSSSGRKNYLVSAVACQCEDYQFNGGVPCKHQWASVGAAAAKLIWQLRTAGSRFDLDRWAQHYAGALIGVPEPFLAAARAEYRSRSETLAKLEKARRRGLARSFTRIFLSVEKYLCYEMLFFVINT